MNDSIKLLAKGAVLLFVTAIISKVFNFLLRLIIARQLGAEEYGLLSLGLAVFSIFTIIPLFGLDQSMERNINFYKKENEKRGVILGGIKISLICSLLSSISLYFLSEAIATNIYHNLELGIILKIFAIAIPIWSINEVILSSLKGLKKIENYSFLKNILDPLLKTMSTIILVLLGYKIIAVAIGFFATYILTLILSIILINKTNLRLWKGEKKDVTKEILNYSWPLLFAGIASSLVLWIDTLMIGYFLGEAKVGIYNVAAPIAGLISIIGASTLSLYLVIITEQHINKLTQSIKDTFIIITRWIFLISFPILCLLILESKNIILVSFGETYSEASSVLIIISLGFFINGLFGPGRLILTSIGKTKFQMINNFISLFSNILLNLYLIPRYGISGAAISTIISLTIRALLTLIEVVLVLKIHPIDKRLIKLGLISLLTFLILNNFKINNTPFISIITTGVLILFIYIPLTILTKSIGNEERTILNSIKKKIF